MGLSENSSPTVYSVQQWLGSSSTPTSRNTVHPLTSNTWNTFLIFTHPRTEVEHFFHYLWETGCWNKALSANLGTSEPAFNSLCWNTRACLDTSLKALSLHTRQARVHRRSVKKPVWALANYYYIFCRQLKLMSDRSKKSRYSLSRQTQTSLAKSHPLSSSACSETSLKKALFQSLLFPTRRPTLSILIEF